MGQGSNGRISEKTVREIESLVSASSWVIRMPAELADGLEVRRLQSFARLVAPGTPLVLVLAVLLAFSGPVMFQVPLLSHDGRLWWFVESVTLALVVTGVSLVHLPPMLARYTDIVVFAASIILGLKLYLTVALHDAELARYETYVCMLVTNLIALAFRLPLHRSLFACVGAGVVATVGILITGEQVSPTGLPVYGIGSAVVSLGIAFFSERQERINFLQGVLLAHESAGRAELNEKLDRIARTDPLTGLANRRHFDERLGEEWERARRNDETVSLLFVDVDHFKSFNDTFGHPAGDSCLSRLAAVIDASARRPADLVARYGGEEFVVLLPNTDVDGARRVATEVLAAVDRLAIPAIPTRFPGHVTVSIGFASLCASEHESVTLLTKTADEALYRAKRSGRHCIVGPAVGADDRVAI